MFFIICGAKYYFDHKTIEIINKRLNEEIKEECEDLIDDMNQLFHDYEDR
jgi:hypothetical protein